MSLRSLAPLTRRHHHGSKQGSFFWWLVVARGHHRSTRRTLITRTTTSNITYQDPEPATPRTLHCEWINKDSNSVAVFLHGLLANGKNLKTLARRYCQNGKSAGLLVDLAGHGKSKDIVASSVQECIQTLKVTLSQQLSLQQQHSWILIGHSFGGRVALEYTANALQSDYNNTVPQRLVLLDTVPGPPNAQVARVLHVVQDFLKQQQHQNDKNDSIQTKTELRQHLQSHYHLDVPHAQWLSTLFNNNNDGTFDFDIATAVAYYNEFANASTTTGSTDDNNVKANNDCNDIGGSLFLQQLKTILDYSNNHHDVKVDLIRGLKNKAWTTTTNSTVQQRIAQLQEWADEYSHKFEIHDLPEASHWVHVDDMTGVLDILNKEQQQ